MAEVLLQDVHKQYGDVVALDRITLDVKDQEFVVMLGPTGAGKTTTLRCIVGLEKVDDGDIVLNGQKINELAPGRRDMAFVSQHYALYPQLTASRNPESPLIKLVMTDA